jgi:RNA polymerase sigma factor (sigma-70 family)
MDDKILIEKVSEGDIPAIRFLVEKYKNLVWHIIISTVGHNKDSEDLFQDVIFRVYKGCKKYRADARLSTWIASIAHNVSIDYIRKRKKEMDLCAPDADYRLVSNTSEDTGWKQTEKEDINRLLLEAITKLPPGYRTAITLYHLDDCSYREISEITGMPEGTVKSYINRGRNMLREALMVLVPDIAEIVNDI